MLNLTDLPAVDGKVYRPNASNDLFLFEWWKELVESGDMEGAYGERGYVLTEFIRLFRTATTVWHTTDEWGKWNRVAWSGAFLGGADFGCWLRKDQRQSKDSLAFVVAVLREIVTRVPVVLTLTADHRVVRDCEQLGFHRMESVIPHLIEEHDAYVLFLERDAFLARVTAC